MPKMPVKADGMRIEPAPSLPTCKGAMPAAQAAAAPALLPPGVRADPIEWPVPERIPSPPFMTYGYADRVTLPARLHLDASWSAGQVLTLGYFPALVGNAEY